MTIKNAQTKLKEKLVTIYEPQEALNITNWVMESLTGLSRIDRLVKETHLLSTEQTQLFDQYLNDLLTYRPVQYVLGEAYFYGHRFYVQEGVLIPRPETEELVDWIVKDAVNKPIDILDIGTGSGCIPVSLKVTLPNATVQSVDISDRAIAIARRNATDLSAEITFLHRDFLSWEQYEWQPIDILVSNPPYIPQSEKAGMIAQVTEHEPSIALFVADEEPLIFYHQLARFGKKYLKENGAVYIEIHEDLGAETRQAFELEGYQTVIIKKDFQGKERMIKARLS
ncbi:peptide chain release factor N(5)-glutamine methyltransferase [Gynurincola endophyticus]|uniref:peptide chain release factor N(5)-glutamine methyltransferase n=1 Tax=Gynurincola endophyticus TaxID=2479004 RepID=UPI000F8C4822|nr:peptide chain release factor N(5)-glutamine methyltransferase [Gynurincola endophyticus]